MLDSPAMKLARSLPPASALAAMVFLFAPLSGAAECWSTAEEWEDGDFALFFTGELRGYVEPCG